MAKNGPHAHIWTTLFVYNSAIFGPTRLTFFMGAQATIFYRLAMKNPNYVAYVSFLIFWATFGVKMGVATTRATSGLGPPSPNSTRKLGQLVL